eukprot:s957_g5.t2
MQGVMWYLHNEVVILCPRHYDITRILRYNVTVFNPAPVFALRGGQFGHFVQFDYGQCTVPDCKANWWDKYGYMVGCQQQDSTMWKYDESYWYSLPGKCPSQKWNDKTAECIAEEAGGNCSSPDGSSTCTWHVEPAGEVSVDDLSGIKNLAAFCAAGNVEYDPDKDRGRGCSFWDDKFNKTRNQDRVMAMQRLFAKNYPTEDALAVPAPMCDGTGVYALMWVPLCFFEKEGAMGCCESSASVQSEVTTSSSLLSSNKPHFLTEQIFKKYDRNGNGLLDVSELKSLMQDAFPGENFSDADMATMHNTLDMDKDGSIGVNELRAFLRLYQPGQQQIRTKTALIIVDVQNDFITGTLANPYSAADIVPIINNLRDKFDVVVISYDWHPHDHCSFVESASEGKEEVKKFDPFTFVTLKEDKDRPEHQQILYPRHAAFFDNMKANDTGLTAMLEKENVTDVYCCGLVTDICVKSTALHGAEVGFNAYVIHDASRPLSNDNIEPTKKVLTEAGVGWVTVDETVKKAPPQKPEPWVLKTLGDVRGWVR